LARGIDSHGHRGALLGEGKTIAVMATSLIEVYPPENRTLFKQIEQEGLLLSETPLSSTARAGLFPRRNRIIAGVSMGTVVVEASMNSGTRYTVDTTLGLGREVFAVPGPMMSPKSEYPLTLIRDGAKLILKVEDIVDELSKTTTFNKSAENIMEPEFSESERKIVEFLQSKPMTIDELLHFSKFSFGHLHSVLLSLSMKHHVEPLPGSLYHLRM
jgi:DNA processing protein